MNNTKFPTSGGVLYILNPNPSPVKVVCCDLPCPEYKDIRCEFSKSRTDEKGFTIYCSADNGCLYEKG